MRKIPFSFWNITLFPRTFESYLQTVKHLARTGQRIDVTNVIEFMIDTTSIIVNFSMNGNKKILRTILET